MPVPPITRDAITAALVEFGPMSVLEIMEATGFGRQRVNGCLSTARSGNPGKFFRIVRYRIQVGKRGRETPIYAAGPGKDAPRPAFDAEHHTARKHGYYMRNRARFAARRKANAGAAVNPWAGLMPMQKRARPAAQPNAN